MFRRVTGLSFIGFAAAFVLPQQYYPDKLKPVNHMLNVAKAGAKMAWVYKFSDKTTQQKNQQASQYLRDGLLKSGGIYIKLGQLIATLDVIVPDQYRNSMMSLTRKCQKSSYQSVRKTIEQQLGTPIQQIFSQFQQQPVSSASIGQVHHARLKNNGQEVAVKIQHRNLLDNVKYDLALMHSFVKIAKFIFKDNFKYAWLIEEFDKNINRELDFEHQASNLQRVKKIIKKQKITNIALPKIVHTPTKRVLIMEYIHGLHVDQVENIQKMGINAKKIGRNFSQLITLMIHKYGFVHADPHSGNLLVRKDRKGRDQLVVLDHGLYQQLDDDLRKSYNKFWLGLILNDENMYLSGAKQMGTINGTLLCCMLTSRTRDQLQSKQRNIYDLNPSTDKGVVLKHAQQWQNQIVQVLNELRRQILLLLKVNEFARSIQNTLGGRQMGVYEDIAKCCVQNMSYSKWQKYRYYWRMYRAH